ncbi:pyruvate kinase [Tepidanaerobacter sp. GT38]|uniref:pyruvate kinase n=1 Tax=Tepidanaerobacter sp. GT38 TaxID=2722793 RepID=UPI001F0098EA|nr:pyruvate kinase [Tepidanaerobacter sp. GT38]MCG1012473.1 pyruvate kinase [Tepidanaerobacter sp. GT38]
MLRTKIICTLGPSSEDKQTIKQLIKAGMNIARINLSHGTHDEHRKRINALKEVCGELKVNVALLLDTKGPEIRLGTFYGGKITLKKGQEFILTSKPLIGDEKIAFINFDNIAKTVEPGEKILLSDGLIELCVKKIEGENVICTVLNSGEIGDRQGVNIPNKSLPLPALTQRDIEDLQFAVKVGADFVAASFVRKADDVREIRRVLDKNGGSDIHIIAKIENQEGINNIDEIIDVADGIMIARGDLGVEIPVQEVPLVQKQIISKCNIAGKPVITATQMLDSMIRNPRPTRAEATDVANAIFDGTDAIMLSGETAAGKYPVEAATMMAKIAEKADIAALEAGKQRQITVKSITDAISHATCSIASELGAKAIITSTKSGYTARAVAKFRPKAPIIAVTYNEKVIKTLQLIRGVMPLKVNKTSTTDEMFHEALKGAVTSGMVKSGDLVVITAGVPVNVTGTTNLIRVHVVD